MACLQGLTRRVNKELTEEEAEEAEEEAEGSAAAGGAGGGAGVRESSRHLKPRRASMHGGHAKGKKDPREVLLTQFEVQSKQAVSQRCLL